MKNAKQRAEEIRRKHPGRSIGPHWEGFCYIGDGVWGDPEVYDWIFDESAMWDDLEVLGMKAEQEVELSTPLPCSSSLGPARMDLPV